VKLEGLNFYLENLLPGVVLLTICLLLLPAPTDYTQTLLKKLEASEFLLPVLFLSTAYLLGLISATVSRFFIDELSAIFPRPLLLAALSHRSYESLRTTLQSLATVGQSSGKPQMDEELIPMDEHKQRKIWKEEVRTAWNRVYRACLKSQADNKEVQRRREQGRVLRNCFFPLVLGSIAIPPLFGQSPNAIFTLVSGLFVILSYAYAELFIFQEASLQVQNRARNIDAA
jgi:hypothetical protein